MIRSGAARRGGPLPQGAVMRAILLLPLALLAACNSTDDSTGVSADEAAQLNAAADMLDINATDPDMSANAPQAKE